MKHIHSPSLKNPPNDDHAHTAQKISAEAWLGFFVALTFASYLSPFHSVVVGYDFFGNSFKYVLLAFGVMGFLALSSIRQLSLSVLSFWSLALLLVGQMVLMPVSNTDGMLLVVGALLFAGLIGLAGSNIVGSADKARFFNRAFVGLYALAAGSFVIQLLQVFELQWWIGDVQLTHLAGNNRLFANILQPNQLAYLFVLALCAVLYHLDKAADRSRLVRWGLWLLFVVIASGIALTKSRAGFVMAVAIFFIYEFAQPKPVKDNVRAFVVYVAVFFGVYVLASWLVSHIGIFGAGGSLGGIARLAESGNRLNLAKQALMIFYDNPVAGAGFGNYQTAMLTNLERFGFSENTSHSHHFLTMILAEMGILGALCLIPIAVVLLRCVHRKHSAESAVALCLVMTTALYSNFEFPLWYFGYLALFALFLGLVEQRYVVLPKAFVLSRGAVSAKYGVLAVLLLSVVVMEYYIHTFAVNRYYDGNRFVFLDTEPADESRVSKDSAIFGLSAYNDVILATQTPISNDDIDNKKHIFKQAVKYMTSTYYLSAYAQTLAYDNQPQEALTYFKYACLRASDVKANCDDVEERLMTLAKEEPSYFEAVYRHFVAWRQQNPSKTGL